MCIVSMVMDHYKDVIPKVDPPWLPPSQPPVWPVFVDPSVSAMVSELRQLISEFREAVAAAKRVDVLTKQPNCVDPEKAKLEARRDGTMTEIQALPLADLRAMLLEHEAAAHRLTDGPARDRHVAIAKGLRSHLPLYAEHRWQVRQWRAKKTRRSVRGAPPPGPIVA